MEEWIILSIISGVLIGLSNFISKISAAKKFNKDRIIFFGNIVFLIISSLYLVFNYRYVEVTFILFLLIALRIIAALQKNLFIIDSLKYIESSIFFPIHKILHVFASFIIGMVLFKEFLRPLELFAVFLGIIMILLLSDKEGKKKQVDYKKGMFYLLSANFVLLFSSSINKYIAVIGFDIPTYLFYSSVFGCLYLMLVKKGIYKKSSNKQIILEIKYGGLRGLMMFFGFLAVLLAFKTGPLVLVGMINSLAILIPIILSILYHDEKVTIKKILSFLIFIIIVILLAVAKTN